MSLYIHISKIFPLNLKRKVHSLLGYAHISVGTERFLGFQTLFVLLLSLAAGFFSSPLLGIPFFLGFFASLLTLEFVTYSLLTLSADATGKFVDNILPDVLQLMASNLRAGMTIDKALFVSARPEFGPFKDELDRLGREVALGKPFETALHSLTSRIHSENLEKSVFLVVSATRAGGELAPILEETAHDLRGRRLADKKIRASIGMYFIFIFVALGVALPALFALSSIVVQVLITTFSAVTVPSSVSTPLAARGSAITSAFVVRYAVVFIGTSSILGSFMLGLIKSGKAKEGFRYIPILLFLGMLIFFSLRKLLETSLSSLFGL